MTFRTLVNSASLATLIFAFTLADFASAQMRIVPGRIITRGPGQVTIVQEAAPPGAVVQNGAAEGDNESSDPGAGEEAEETPEQIRLKLLLAAKFDRTSAAVLKAWSFQPRETSDEEKTVEKVSGSIANSFEGFVVLNLEKESKLKADQTAIVHREEKEVGRVKILSVDGKTLTARFVNDSPAETVNDSPAETVNENPDDNSEADVESTPGDAEPSEIDGKTKEGVDTVAEPAVEDASSDSKIEKTVDQTASDEAAEDQVADSEEKAAAEAAQTAPAVYLELKAGDTISISAAPEPAAKVDPAKVVQEEVDAFVRHVTLGQWEEVKSFLAGMKPEDANKVYTHLLSSLTTATPPVPPGTPPEMVDQVKQQMIQQMQQNGQTPPTSFLTPDDILQLSEASPVSIRISLTDKKARISAGDPVSGRWSGQIRVPDVGLEVEVEFNLILQGGNVSGNISVQGQIVPLDSGSFDDSSGAITMTATNSGSTGTLSATIKDSEMTGTMSADGMSTSFSAKMIESTAVAKHETQPDVAENELPPGSDAKNADAENASGKDSPVAKPDGAPHIIALANLIKNSIKAGHDFSAFVEQLESGTTHFGGSDDPLKRLTAADLLMKANLIDDVEKFLPVLDDEKTKSNLTALKLWSQLAITKHQQKKVAEWLDKAWQANQLIASMKDIETADSDLAMTNLIELSPRIDRELGQKWLDESFTESPDRGMQILTNLGTNSARMALQASQISEGQRLKLLRLQNEAVENLIRVSPEKASQWKQALTLLAQNWLTEAATSIQYSRENSSREYRQYDMYGNSYWVDEAQMMQRYNGNSGQPRPIKIGDVLEIGPGQTWQKNVDPSLNRQFQKLYANLHLRVNEEDKAFPYIEKIALKHPDDARNLVHEFLRIWTRNHDPNTDKRQRNPYIYFYGFDQKAEAIPLTRSKQERNLKELSGWVQRIRKLNIEDIDEQKLADAFTTCHSSAEVFHLDRVRSVFGELENLKPETVAAICQKMRANLTENWRDIRNQEQKQTNRREPEVQREVLRGYSVARQLADEALRSSPDNWQLHLARACLMFDENAYSQTVQKSAEFSDNRDMAFQQFEVASQKYIDIATTLEELEQSTEVFDLWFYAALGACDLGKITDKTVPDLRQYPKIREAIDSMQPALAESHMSNFANNLFTRMSPIKPEIKFRYLRGGFEIVGAHPRAWEARNLYQYYRDLVSEIKLAVNIDGDDNVGHKQPFGIYVNLLHTTEIEREAGGFGKYVQNQNSMMYSYNYGRPTEDYRDKFTDSVRQALEENFEILNITFQSPDTMQSRAAPQTGWRFTPYAYILLKPVGSEVDRIAPLKLDLDFLDTSGYVVIPVESPAVVVDATADKASPRPVSDLEITQTLDERQADEGKLIVEVSATAKGLVPDLEDMIDIKREDFEVVSIDDQGVLPSSFDKDGDAIQIVSDRSWTVEYRAKENENKVSAFQFGDSRLSDAAVKFQRYDDADLVAAEQTVELERNYATFSWGFLYWLIPLIVVGLCCLAGGIYVATRPVAEAAKRFDIPEDVNPFTVLTLLKNIKERNGISNEQAGELDQSINRVEEYYFGKTEAADQPDDLSRLAETWVARAN